MPAAVNRAQAVAMHLAAEAVRDASAGVVRLTGGVLQMYKEPGEESRARAVLDVPMLPAVEIKLLSFTEAYRSGFARIAVPRFFNQPARNYELFFTAVFRAGAFKVATGDTRPKVRGR